MKTSKTLLSTLVALALAAPVFGQAPPAPAPAQAPAQAPVQAAAGPNTWTLDPAHTGITFKVRHMMVANVNGSFPKYSGTVTYDGKDVSSVAADITIDATSITTNNEKRDAHLKSPDFFDVATYPTITFKSKRVQKGAAGTFKLIGDLTIRGVTKEVTLDIEGPSQPIQAQGATKIGATATTTINRQDYGVKWSRNLDGGGVVVGDEVKITLELELNKRAPAPPTQ
jgi:polyisoprenoid-binding protein YceI